MSALTNVADRAISAEANLSDQQSQMGGGGVEGVLTFDILGVFSDILTYLKNTLTYLTAHLNVF